MIFREPVDGRRPWLVIALSCASLAGIAGRARADGPFEGTWREGPLSIQVAVQSWGGDCGPRPQSTSAPGGGSFEITQSGDDLTFHLRQQRTTRGCWSENRAVRRVSSTHSTGTWRIVCRTPAEDSRGETGTYTIQAIGDNQLSFRDVSAYDWQLNESRCLATITTTQTFTRVSAPAQAEEPAHETPRPACTPGAPARLVVRPAATDLSPGGQQCFTTRLTDANGCAVRSQRVALSLAEGSAGTLSGHCYTAPSGDGTARIVARAGSLRSEARVSVHAIDLSDLIARRTESGSLGNGAPEQDAEAQTAARVSARAVEERDLRWPAIAIGVALLLVIGAVIALVRRRRPASGIRGLPDVDLSDPGVQTAYRSSEPPPEPKSQPPPAGPREDLICPTCRRGYPPGVTDTCPHDGATLVPYKSFAASPGTENVCPTCGERYPAHVKFCGKDGAVLESRGG